MKTYFLFFALIFLIITNVNSQDSLNLMITKPFLTYKKGKFYSEGQKLKRFQLLIKVDQLQNQSLSDKINMKLELSDKLRRRSPVFFIISGPLFILGSYWLMVSNSAISPISNSEQKFFQVVSVSFYSLSLSSIIVGSTMNRKSKKQKLQVAELYNQNL